MIIFNAVFAGDTFWHLRYFVCSQIEQSDAQFRLVANTCSPETLTDLHEFAHRHADRVVEVLEVSPADTPMIGHGLALDAVLRVRDDGDHFCFIDPDIKALHPFLGEFRELLSKYDAVTSGKELWTDDNVLPPDHFGVGGRHFYDSNGFILGSPHFAMYDRATLDETCGRWSVGLGSYGPEVSETTRDHLAEAGHPYKVFDTGKMVNILFQLDGHTLWHFDHPDLLHIGGLSHFLDPGEPSGKGGEVVTPDWARYSGVQARLEVTRYTAAVLRSTIEQREVPPLPAGLEPAMLARLEVVRSEMIDLVERYRDW